MDDGFNERVIATLLDKAVDKRAGLLDGGTNALRLVDGAGDGVPGFALEDYAGKWMAMTPGGEIQAEVKAWLRRAVGAFIGSVWISIRRNPRCIFMAIRWWARLRSKRTV